MVTSLVRNLVLAMGLCFALVACDSVEERAKKYFASALEFIDDGDLDRAAIELRNVFELMPNHVEARETMARIMLERNDKSAAYGQYLRLVEQVPDHVEGRTVLAEIAFEARSWQEFLRHAKKAVDLAPEAPRSRIIDVALRYQEAIETQDGPARDALREEAEQLARDAPDSDVLQQILFDAHLRNQDPDRALEQLDRMIARAPENRTLYRQRLTLLDQMQDIAGMEQQLREMVTRFADDDDPKEDLIRFYVAQNQRDKAEAFFREIADPTSEDPKMFIGFVRFLHETHGPDTARAELEAALDVSPEPEQLHIFLAVLDFEAGAQDKAIADLRALADKTDAGEQAQDIKIILAQMLLQTGETPEAQRLVNAVLEVDSRHVDALKMRAAWAIDTDDTDAAIADLRLALDTTSDDLDALSLMSDAYRRAGNQDLARDFLALAVDASDHAPRPTLAYARALASEERYLAAEEVLIPALRQNRANADLLVLLGEIYLASEDYARADHVIRRLRELGTDRTLTVANALQAQLLGSQEGTEQALEFLRELAEQEGAGLNTQIALLRARLSSGQTEQALVQAKALADAHPDNLALRFILATAHAANGDSSTGETLLTALLDEDPGRTRVWGQLYRLQRVQGDDAAASQTLRDGLAVDPNNRDLLWLQASEFETAGDIDGAISNYERIYARNSEDVVVLNNLASLLATYRSDDESLDRAWSIARRLRGTDAPALQHTFGWVAFRAGNVDEALPYLEASAAALPQNATVQFHLGQAYGAADQREAAIAQYQLTLDLAESGGPHSHVEAAQAEIARLEQAPVGGE